MSVCGSIYGTSCIAQIWTSMLVVGNGFVEEDILINRKEIV
jgi:hypothetical protein